MILILNFSLCKVNCAVTGLQDVESTDEGGIGGIAKKEKIPGGWRNGKSLLYELTKVLVG